jgi:ParB/RepB/Spo0J family partition protein
MKTAKQYETGGYAALPLTSIVPSQLVPQIKRRSHFKDQELAELADSIKSKGLISPITVRPIAGDSSSFEIVAGERRYLASKLAGLEAIEAVIRELSDQDALEIQLHENLKRLNVEPLDEAFSYQYLLEHAQLSDGDNTRAYSIADIASRFAKTEEIILRRLKLIDLVEDGKTDLSNGKLPLAHAELIARFPVKAQAELLKDHTYHWNGGAVAFKDLQLKVEQYIVRNLKKAKFDVADPSLRKDGLVCGSCTERTGYSPKLFDGDLATVDHCLNGACFKAKLIESLKNQRRSLAEKLPNPKNLPIEKIAVTVPLLRNYYGSAKPLGDGAYIDDSNWQDHFKHVKKGECEFTEKALYVETDKIGSIALICRSVDCKVHKVKKAAAASSTRSGSMQNDHLKRKEDEFNNEVADKVRVPILVKHIDTFGEDKTVFEKLEWERRFLAMVLSYCGYEFEDRCEQLLETVLNKEVRKLVSGSSYVGSTPEKYLEEINQLSSDDVSKLFALIAFGDLGYSEYEPADLGPIKSIAAELGENFDLLDAQARLELAPDEHKAAAQAHLDKIAAGESSSVPHFFWPKPKTTEKAKSKAKKKAAV